MEHANRKFIILFLLLTSFSSVNCLGQDTPKGSIDSVEIWIKEINDDTAKLKVVQKDIFGQSTEGGFLRSYYDGNTLRKAIFTLFGETGQSTSEYYFLNGEIIFLHQKELRYKSPIYMGKTEIESQKKNKYYFKNQKLIRWISNDGKIVDAILYPEKEKEILDDVKSIQ